MERLQRHPVAAVKHNERHKRWVVTDAVTHQSVMQEHRGSTRWLSFPSFKMTQKFTKSYRKCGSALMPSVVSNCTICEIGLMICIHFLKLFSSAFVVPMGWPQMFPWKSGSVPKRGCGRSYANSDAARERMAILLLAGRPGTPCQKM